MADPQNAPAPPSDVTILSQPEVPPLPPLVAAPPAEAPAWFRRGLALLLVFGGLVRIAILANYLGTNRLADHPILDAYTYWEWAGRIAAGQITGDLPFFSAPLYPFLLAAVRSAGGTPTTVYGVQLLLDLLTAGLIAALGRRRFGPAVGLIAAALYLLLMDPASFALRILAPTLQVTLYCVVWLCWLRAQEQYNPARAALLGLALGAAALAYPPALYLLPLAALAGWWHAGWSARRLGPVALTLLCGAGPVALATLHNFQTTGAFYPVQAVVGVNFAAGNGPDADGTYRAIPGVIGSREEMFESARAKYRAVNGRAGTWPEIDRHFRDQALAWLRADPLRAARLAGQKLWWFLSGRHHSEIYVPTAEIADGFTPRLQLAPLHVSWLLPLALVVLLRWARHLKTYLPELALFCLPVLVVIVFWYSPRYRVLSVPVAAVAVAWGLWEARRWRVRPAWTAATLFLLALGVGTGVANHARGIDELSPRRAPLYVGLGWAAAQDGDLDEALACYARAAALEPDYPTVAATLGDLLLQMGRVEAAETQLRRAIDQNPDDAASRSLLAGLLESRNALDEAVVLIEAALRLQPEAADLWSNYGLLLLRRGDLARARAQWEHALELDPDHAQSHLQLARLAAHEGALETALDHYAQAIKAEPTLVPAFVEAARLFYTEGAPEIALNSLVRAHQLAPQDPEIATELAWLLATTPNLGPNERVAALRLAQQLREGLPEPGPLVHDTLGAALAANGRYEEAIASVTQALSEMESLGGPPDLAGAMRYRLELYRAGKPYLAALAGPSTQPATSTAPTTSSGPANGPP